MPLEIEMIVHGRMYRNEFLQTLHLPEFQHRAFLSSEWEVRIFGAIVDPPPGFLPAFVADYLHRSAIRSELVRYYDLRIAISLHGFSQEFQGSSLVASLGNETFQNFAFVIDGAPKVVQLAIDLHEHLIQMPLPLGRLTHVGCTLFPDLVSEVSAETIDPEAHTFMTNVDTALMQKIFDIA